MLTTPFILGRRALVTPGERPAPLPARAVMLVLSLTLSAGSALALDLLVVDQAGAPVPGAVIWTTAPSDAPPADRDPVVVDQRDKRFSPFVTVVAPGTEVRFPNSDDTRHHVYSFSEGNRFERKLFRANDAAPVRFDTPGVVALGCNIHDNMEAYVLVGDLPGAVVSDGEGMASVDVEDLTTVQLWHPLLPDTMALPPLATTAVQVHTVTLPLIWEDPQAARSVNELEQLLKTFSRHAE